ncbi:hypothetical protein AHMF7605_11705 [Adhaeribacter arboris]|uniref:Uncharacterized protein n=1 Tax=Adhaeribacter arboris TaxID=2072846 RepID=A0A2T2YF51_9BACT|nr:hypothetical protein [Adhaeribacter arboris]PSR54137.1 hypothetical protein AHMF7605_11705 [Adhaeribacter arboris]
MSKLTKAEFIAKWAVKFAPNGMAAINGGTFQEWAADIKDSFATETAIGDYLPKSSVKGVLSESTTDVPNMKLVYELMADLGEEIGKGILSISVGNNTFHPEALTGNLEMPWHAGTHSKDGNDPLSPGDIGAEPAITNKGTAFNKDFGTASGTVMQGNDSRVTGALPRADVLNAPGQNTDKTLSQKYISDQFQGVALAIQNISTVTNGLSAGAVLLTHLSQEVLDYIGTNSGGSGGTGARIADLVYTNTNSFALPTGYPQVDKVIIYNALVPRILYDAQFTRAAGSDQIVFTTTLLAGDVLSVIPVRSGGATTGSNYTLPDASKTGKGGVTLSVVPLLASAPIAVGDNDPRLTTEAQQLYQLDLNPDINTTSNSIAIKGKVATVVADALNNYDATAIPLTNYTYEYKLNFAANWTTASTVAALQTAIATTSDTQIMHVRAINTVTLVPNSLLLTIRKI